MSVEKLRANVVAFITETATEDQVKAHAILMNAQLMGTPIAKLIATPTGNGDPDTGSVSKGKTRGIYGSKGGPVMQTFVALYREGVIAPTLAVLRDRIREGTPGKYFASNDKLYDTLRKTPRIYKNNQDGTWSMVRPPKPVLIKDSEPQEKAG